ncbi:hypothetical protein [Streptomyces sp. NBC_00385]|uniref:hypothetical protein n=1 Tax=Streptomyces sp. NBC_00385 TaxID=2975733 RepID=UPI002DDC0D66|nr:hypothetical protein [Streptomyces sp. NBC_00385]WRZ05061.1 hypothetical protein OG959_17740 [Streptomyces sp. NBC_00385]
MTEDPTREQLLHLAERARRGVLLPAEGALLADAMAELTEEVVNATQTAEFYEAAHSRMRDRAEVAEVRATAHITGLEQRAEQAEAAIERVRAELALCDWPHAEVRADRITDALDQAQQPTTTEAPC